MATLVPFFLLLLMLAIHGLTLDVNRRNRYLTVDSGNITSEFLSSPTVLSCAHSKNSSGRTGDEKRFVVGTMTTTPSRLSLYGSGMKETLERLLSIKLLNRFYLNIPWYYGLRRKENVTIPDELLKLIEITEGRLRILRSVDYGPATKLLPTVLLDDVELPQDSMVITFDDDRLYTEEAVVALVSAAEERPDSVITIAAWPVTILSSHGKRGKPHGPDFYSSIPHGSEGVQYVRKGSVDLILGFYGVLYRKRFFYPDNQLDKLWFGYELAPGFQNHCSWVDDIWFSGHLERRLLNRYCIGNVPRSRADITELSNANALSLDKGESVKQNHDNVLCAQAMRHQFSIWQKK